MMMMKKLAIIHISLGDTYAMVAQFNCVFSCFSCKNVMNNLELKHSYFYIAVTAKRQFIHSAPVGHRVKGLETTLRKGRRRAQGSCLTSLLSPP